MTRRLRSAASTEGRRKTFVLRQDVGRRRNLRGYGVFEGYDEGKLLDPRLRGPPLAVYQYPNIEGWNHGIGDHG